MNTVRVVTSLLSSEADAETLRSLGTSLGVRFAPCIERIDLLLTLGHNREPGLGGQREATQHAPALGHPRQRALAHAILGLRRLRLSIPAPIARPRPLRARRGGRARARDSRWVGWRGRAF